MAWVRNSVVAIVVLFGACRTYDVTYTDDAGSSCDAGPLTVCNGACVDVSSDRFNCGSCGNACAQNQLCSESFCTTCPGKSEVACGTSGAAFCADLSSDTTNCGSCGNACSHGSLCSNSTCVCPLTTCGTDCIDTQNDVQHCGDCNTPCSTTGANETPICSKGQCSSQCIAPFSDCDGVGSNGCEANLQTSSGNCGVCNRVCGGNGTCTAGVCPIITYATGQLGGLAVDSSFVYFVNQSSTNGGIEKVPIGGGTAQLVYADNQATALAIDSGRIVWLHVNTLIQSQLLTGGTVSTLATLSGVQTLTTSAGYAYYSTGALAGRVVTDGSAAPVTITSLNDPLSAAVDSTTIYLADFTGEIWSAPIDQQNATAKTFEVVDAMEIAQDANSIYWIGLGLEVQSHPKTGTAQPTTLATNEKIATNLVTDGVALYWGATDGSIHRLPVSGGISKTLATNQGDLRFVAVDATSVYWTSTTLVAATSK